MSLEIRPAGLAGEDLIREGIRPRGLEAYMGNYKEAQLAFLELMDNAVDNRKSDSPINIRIRIAKDEINIINIGGRGLDRAGLERFFQWGESDKTSDDIGIYGVGGKAAMGYLGRSIEVTCSAEGSDEEFSVADSNWDTRPDGVLKVLTVKKRQTPIQEGYFRAKITDLKKGIDARTLEARLGEVYRPLILEGRAIITVNNRPVEAKEIRYDESDPILKPETYNVQTRFGDSFEVRVGILPEGSRQTPGIACYHNGRLIEGGQFFGLPTPAQMPQSSRLFGEAHFNFVPVTSNKSNYIENSVQWDQAVNGMKRVLSPWETKLRNLRMDHSSPVENYEKELAKRAKRILDGVLATTSLVTKSMLPGGEAGGRLPAGLGKSKPRRETEGGGTRRGPKEGQTAPDPRADVGVDRIRRWGAFVTYETAPMGVNGKRSDVTRQNDRNTLIINSDHPMYQANKRIDDAALGLYLLESAVLKIAELVRGEGSVEEYVDFTNTLLAEVGMVYKNQVSPSRQRRGRRS